MCDVSTVICTYNRKKLVKRAIESALKQEDVSNEIIVVDDGSTDGTGYELRRAYGNRINVIELEKNGGVSAATNVGFAHARGNFIALLGDDDYWTDTRKLRKQIGEFENSNRRIGVVGTWWQELYGDGKLETLNPLEPDDWEGRLLQAGGIICGSTALVSREAWISAGGLDEKMPRGTDSDLFRRIVFSGYGGKLVREPTTVVDVGHSGKRMTSQSGYRGALNRVRAHSYILWKYRNKYLSYPKAASSRIKIMIISFFRTLFR